MKLLPGRILLLLLALMAGIALGAGLVGAFQTPDPPSIEPIQLDGDGGDESGEDGPRQSGKRKTENGPNETPADDVAPPPPPPPPPANDDDDDDDGGGTDDGGGDD
jgi:hypothetical protein